MSKKVKFALNILYPLITFALIAGIWAIAAAVIGVEIVLPAPSVAIGEFFSLLSDKIFYASLLSTFLRSLYSFVIAFVCAFATAVLGYLVKPFYKIFNPAVMVMRAIPTMSVILLCIIWLSARTSPVVIAFLIVFPVIYSGTYSAIGRVDDRLVMMSRIYKIPLKDRLTKLYMPAIAPEIMDSCRSAVGLNLKVLIAAEVLAATKNSLGNMMQLAKVSLDTASLFAYTIAAIILSFILEGAVYLIKRALVRWPE